MTTTWQLGSFTGAFESIGNHHTCKETMEEQGRSFSRSFVGAISNHQLGLGNSMEIHRMNSCASPHLISPYVFLVANVRKAMS